MIAAVNGLALGGGFELVLACDLVIAVPEARFGLPEPKVGTAALAGGLQRLPRQIGLKRAMDMILTASLVDAAQGREFGFVNDIVPRETLLSAARAKADRIAAQPPGRARFQTMRVGRHDALRRSGRGSSERDAGGASDDESRGPNRGRSGVPQRRPPVWSGR